MTRNEAQQVLMVIQAAYPNYHPQNKTVTVDLWTTMFGDYDYQAVITAVQAYIATDESGFAPAIGQVMAKLRMLQSADELTGMEAWAMVSKAIRNGIYGSVEEFDKLPPDVQRAVGSAGQLRIWAMDEDYNESVVMSQFLKSYQTVTARREELEKIPANIREMLGDASQKLIG